MRRLYKKRIHEMPEGNPAVSIGIGVSAGQGKRDGIDGFAISADADY